MRSYRKESRIDWGTSIDGDKLTIEQINCGALLRIADASERMAENFVQLQQDRDYWKQRAQNAEVGLDTEIRRSRALRACLKRKKR